MGHWVMGQTGQQIWVGHVGYWSTRDPLNHFTLYSSGIPRDILLTENQQRQSKLLFGLPVSTFSESL